MIGTYSSLLKATTLPKELDKKEDTVFTATERSQERTEIRSENRTPMLPTKRRTKRYSFEFYDDQITKLKRLKYEAEMRGDSLTLSDIVRQALDNYLEKNS